VVAAAAKSVSDGAPEVGDERGNEPNGLAKAKMGWCWKMNRARKLKKGKEIQAGLQWALELIWLLLVRGK
jgi:hypothetical protein